MNYQELVSGSICDSGNYPYGDNVNIFDSRLPICENIREIDELLNVKSDLISFLDIGSVPSENIEKELPFMNSIRKFIAKGNELRDSLRKAEKEYEEYRSKVDNDIYKINAFLDFVAKLNSIPTDHHKIITESIEILKKDVNDKNKLNEIKNTYNTQREKYTEYLTELFKLNHLNVGNKCSICLTNIVDTFYIPCGHTICSDCDKPDTHKKCHICRANVQSVKKLYFI